MTPRSEKRGLLTQILKKEKEFSKQTRRRALQAEKQHEPKDKAG